MVAAGRLTRGPASSAEMGKFTFGISSSKALLSPPIPSSLQLNLASNIPFNPTPFKFSIFSRFQPHFLRSTSFRVSATRIPARDRIIELGKYRGKMLGSLPSNYLKWVSKNLRAGDMEEWAKLADEVLSDPVYRDRIEWEFAEKILNGNTTSPCSNRNGSHAVSELLEISERFGWDNEDKQGWSKIDFGLLGSSKGGRIPRLVVGETKAELGSLKKEKMKVEETSVEDGGKRTKRRERMRTRRLQRGGGGGGGGLAPQRRVENMGHKEIRDGGEADPVVLRSPFPGRKALLNDVLRRRKI